MDIRVISAITTFFEVFYTQRCYDRYIEMHGAVNQVRSMHRFCFDFKQDFAANQCNGSHPRPGMEYLRLAMRWMHAHTVLFFTEVRHGPLVDEQWRQIVDIGLLHYDEVNLLKDYTGAQRGFILIDWVAKVVVEAHCKNDDHDKGSWRLLINRIIEHYEAVKCVMDLVRMPVPFQYFHMLNIMLMMNVSLWAYAMAMSEFILAPMVYFFASFIFIGMLELAKLFSDPFGDDEVDFPIQIWCDKFLENQLAYLEYDGVATSDQFFQTKLRQQGRLDWQPGEVTALIGTRRKASLGGGVHKHRDSLVHRGPVMVPQEFTSPIKDYGYEPVPSSAQSQLMSEHTG